MNRYHFPAVIAVLSSILFFAACSGVPPATLGVHDHSLSACPETPNCVISRPGDAGHSIAPLPFAGPASVAMNRLKTIILGMPRSRVVTDTDTYLHAEFRSLIFRFVDDAEFLVDDDAKTIDVRSAARTGTYDFGVNRRRIETLRSLWLSEAAK